MDLVDAADRLTRIFGEWPCFHDAEVTRVVLDRSGPEGPTLDAEIHVAERTDEVDRAGFFVLRHHTLVSLRFHGVNGLELSGFNHQNVLSELTLEALDAAAPDRRRIRVAFGGCFGVGASFECRRCEVLRALPWTGAS